MAHNHLNKPNGGRDSDDGPDGAGNGGEGHHEHGEEAPITFNQIDATAYLHADNHANGTFDEDFVWRVTGLEQNGVHVDLPGLGSKFGMYFIAHTTGHATPGGLVFDTFNVALMVDPGNNDGAVKATTAGITFANGTSGDFALARGTIVSGTFFPPDATGTRHADFVQTMTVTDAGEDVFGHSLTNGAMLRELLTTPAPTFQFIPPSVAGGDGTTLINGGSAVIQLTPPGPLSLMVEDLRHHGG